MEQNNLNQRLIMALVLSFAIMVGFSYMFPQAKMQQQEINDTSNPNQTTTRQDNVAPQVDTTHNASAPSKTKQSPGSGDKNSLDSKVIATVSAPNFIFKIDSLGRISSAKLLQKKYKTKDGEPLELLEPKAIKPLEVRFSDASLNTQAFQVNYIASTDKLDVTDAPQALTMSQKLGDIVLSKKITFYADGHYDIDISVNKPVDFFVTPGHRPEADHSMYMIVRGALIRDSHGVITTVEDKKADKQESVGDATIISAFDRYAASMLYRFEPPFQAILSPDNESKPLGFVSAKGTISLHGYIGPKEYRTLQHLDPRLTDAIEFGWFTFLSRPFFKVMVWIHDFVGNWGWAIIIFTILVKLVLFPLSYKGMMSMQKMKELAPKMKELKEKYKGDPAKLNQQTMALYKKHGANPMGGCLPMLLQVPVFFALYRVLLNADELQGAPWVGWIVNLADKDPYYILPLLMGVSMWFMQKVQPNTMTDPMQQKIFQWFPVIMTFFFLTFPSGLVLYWLTNNILSIGQQYIINGAVDKQKAKQKIADTKKE